MLSAAFGVVQSSATDALPCIGTLLWAVNVFGSMPLAVLSTSNLSQAHHGVVHGLALTAIFILAQVRACCLLSLLLFLFDGSMHMGCLTPLF
jgi:hypothetical protein